MITPTNGDDKTGRGTRVTFVSRAPGTFFSLFFDYTNVYLESMVCVYGHHHHNTQPQWWVTGLKMHLCLEFLFFFFCFFYFYLFIDVVLVYSYGCHFHHHSTGNASHAPQQGLFLKIQLSMQTTYMGWKGHYFHQHGTQWQPDMHCISCPNNVYICATWAKFFILFISYFWNVHCEACKFSPSSQSISPSSL